MKKILTLENSHLSVDVVPALGGGVGRFCAKHAGTYFPVFRQWDGYSDDPNTLAMFVLLPWSNRNSASELIIDNIRFPLPHNMPKINYPIHGNAWQSQWQVQAYSDTCVELSLKSSDIPPFHYRALLKYCLDGKALNVKLSVKNIGTLCAPYGMGLHPWFTRTSDTTLLAPASHLWLTDSQSIPTQKRAISRADDYAFSTAKALPTSLIDNGFDGWDGSAVIAWQDAGISVQVKASDNISRYILYSPSSCAGFFCFEPITHVSDALNLSSDPQQHGIRFLHPGETFAMSTKFTTTSND